MATLSEAYVRQYLGRIGLPAGADRPLPPPTLPTLAQLHSAHLRAVPFENLSLQLEAAKRQHGIDTDLHAIFKKIVGSRRGGYCFEQNGLFGSVLCSLGFDVIDAAARVVQSGDDEPGEVEEAPPLPSRSKSGALGIIDVKPELRLSGHDHHILLVSLPHDGQEGQGSGAGTGSQPSLWLADCGFGGESLPLPLLLPEGAASYAPPQPGSSAAAPYVGQAWAEGLPVDRLSRYRVRLGLPGLLASPDPARTPHYGLRAGYYLQHLSPSSGDWKDLYFFRLDEFLPQDYAMQNHYIQHNPCSHFRTNLVVARHTPEGRLTILNQAFRVWREGKAAPREERQLEGDEELLAVLDQHFGIVL